MPFLSPNQINIIKAMKETTLRFALQENLLSDVAVSLQALADCWEIASVSSISVSMHQSQTFFKSQNSMSCLDLSLAPSHNFATSALTW